MKTVAELKQLRAGLLAEAAAFADVAKNENRDLKAEETARVDAILGAEGKPGELANIDEEIVRAEKVEAAKRRLLDLSNLGRHDQHHPAGGEDKKISAESDFARITIPARAHRVPHSQMHVKGDNADRKLYAFGQWFMGAMGNQKSKEWATEHGFEYRSAMTEGLDTKGGFTVPEQFETMVIDLRNEYGVARRECKIETMTSDTKVIPRRAGGLTAYFVGEAATITASDKTWNNVRLTANKLAAIARYSSELNEDSVVALANDLASEIAYAFATKEDQCVFLGDGTSTYGGIVGIKNALGDGSEVVAATGNTSFATLDIEDFLAVKAKLPSYAYGMGGPKWYIHRTGYALSMERLQLAAGGNVVANIAAGGQPSFLGYPVVFVEVMNSTTGAQTSTEGLCYFGNLRMASIFGDRRGMSLAQSTDVYFTTDELAIRGTERFDFNLHDRGDSSNAGAIIGLETPGS